MSSGRKRFKILTHRKISVVTEDNRWQFLRPEYFVASWCPKRKRFRIKETLAVGVPYNSYWRWTERTKRKEDEWVEFGQQLADQNNLPWVKTFDPSWKLHDLMLMRLKGKV